MIKLLYRLKNPLQQIAKLEFSELNKKPNLYTLLELKQGATPEQIRYNYFKLMSKYRPEGAKPDEELKHSRLLNEAYAILSNHKLRQKYDNQNGFARKGKQENQKENKLNLNKSDKMDQDYKEAKRGFSAVLGDKQTRFQQKLLGVAAITMFIATIFLLINGKNYKKSVLANNPQTKKQ